MLRCRLFAALSTAAALVLSPAFSFGQLPGMSGGSGPSVAANGSVTVKLKPSMVRLVIQLPGKGKTMEEALAQLTDRRDAARLKVAELGASKETIVTADPVSIDGASSDQQRQMQRMLVQMRAQGRRVPAKPPAPSIAVQSTLSAEWQLTAKTPDELLTSTHKLEDAIRKADLGGANQPQEPTPEEQEVAEEMENADMYGMSEEGLKPGEPQFLYVARLSDDQRQKALADAFAKAKAEARQLATAAGAQLGDLISLSSMSSPVNDMSGNNYRQYAQMMYLQQMANEGQIENEIAGPQPGLVSFRIAVMVEFQLK